MSSKFWTHTPQNMHVTDLYFVCDLRYLSIVMSQALVRRLTDRSNSAPMTCSIWNSGHASLGQQHWSPFVCHMFTYWQLYDNKTSQVCSCVPSFDPRVIMIRYSWDTGFPVGHLLVQNWTRFFVFCFRKIFGLLWVCLNKFEQFIVTRQCGISPNIQTTTMAMRCEQAAIQSYRDHTMWPKYILRLA